jgi:hypothetical protein
MGPVLGVLTAVSGVVGAVGAIQSSAAQRRAARLQEQQQAVATRRSQRQAIRQAVIARGAAINNAGAANALGGSGLAGGVSSVGSQVGEQLGFSTQMSGISGGINAANRSAARWGALSQLGFTGFQMGGGFNGIMQSFNGSSTTNAPVGQPTRPTPRPSGGVARSALPIPVSTGAPFTAPTRRPDRRILFSPVGGGVHSLNGYGVQ